MGLINAVKKAWNVFNRDGTNTILDQDTRLDQTEFDLAEVTNDQLLRRYTTELHLMLQHLIFGTYYSTTKNDTKMKLTMD